MFRSLLEVAIKDRNVMLPCRVADGSASHLGFCGVSLSNTDAWRDRIVFVSGVKQSKIGCLTPDTNAVRSLQRSVRSHRLAEHRRMLGALAAPAGRHSDIIRTRVIQ